MTNMLHTHTHLKIPIRAESSDDHASHTHTHTHTPSWALQRETVCMKERSAPRGHTAFWVASAGGNGNTDTYWACPAVGRAGSSTTAPWSSVIRVHEQERGDPAMLRERQRACDWYYASVCVCVRRGLVGDWTIV